jgi:hypothetical protein
MSQLRRQLPTVAAPPKLEQAALEAVRQSLEQPIPFGNELGLLGLKQLQKHLCRLRIVVAPLERRNHLALKGDAFLRALHQVFALLQSTL